MFLLIAGRVGTKTPGQCRSHHQKMMKFSGSVENVVQRFSEYFEGQEKEKAKEFPPQIEPLFVLKTGSSVTANEEPSRDDLRST